MGLRFGFSDRYSNSQRYLPLVALLLLVLLLVAGVALTAGFQLGWGPLGRRHALSRFPRPLHAAPPSSGNGDRAPKRTGGGDSSSRDSAGTGNGSSSSRRPPPQLPRADGSSSGGSKYGRSGKNVSGRGGGRPTPVPSPPSSSSNKPPFKRPGQPPRSRVVVGRALLAITPGDSEAILTLLDQNRDRLNPADCALALKRWGLGAWVAQTQGCIGGLISASQHPQFQPDEPPRYDDCCIPIRARTQRRQL